MRTQERAGVAERAAPRPDTVALVRLIVPLVTLVLLLGLAGPVAAHAEFVSSDPADGAVLAAPPTSVTLTFSEGLDASKSHFELLGPDGTNLGTGKAAGDGDETMTLDGLELGPGAYTVEWTSVSLDTDILRGKVHFTVTEPTPAPATPGPTAPASEQPSDAATPAATPAPTPDAGSPAASIQPVTTGLQTTSANSTSDILPPIIAVVAVIAIVGLYLFRRSRSA